MKKKFFKKLSFVLALAMIISVVAPAAGAFAAAAPKLNSTRKYLHLAVDGKDEFNFNISNKKSGWKYFWESSDENVVVVNEKNGVTTATGAGTAKVSVVITDKDGEEQAELKATVTVRDNIKELTITNKPEGDKLAVGVENDFNRDYVTNANLTKGSQAITRWVVEPSDGATISDKGVFVATKAGDYKITAVSFQSKPRYTAWLKTDMSLTHEDVTATASYEFTVAPSMVSAKQVDLDTVNVTFDSAMTDVDKNIAVYQLVGDTKVKQIISKVEMDDAKKVASVSLYIPFAKGSTFSIEYPNMDAVSFKAATTNAEDVTSMKVHTTTAVKNVEKAVEVKLFNAEGVDITTDTLLTRVTMKSSGEQGTFFNEATKRVLIFETGKTTTITATYHTYKYNSTTGAEEGNVTAAGIITGVDADATNITGLAAWTIVTSGPDFNDVKQMLAADDYGKRLFVKLNNKTGNTTGSVNSDANSGDFDFTSSDESILIVGSNGSLYPVKEGVATVVVKYATSGTKVPVATVAITVSAKKAATNFTLDAYEFSLSNTVGLGDSKNVKMTMKDQLGRPFVFTGYKVERLSAPLQSDGVTMTTDNVITPVTDTSTTSNADGEITITFNGDSGASANPIDKGVYVYKITAKDISRVVTVNVQEANNSTVSYYRLALGTTSKDMKIASWTSLPQSVSIDLFGYSSNGVKLVKVDLTNTTDAFRVEVDAPWDSVNPDGQKFLDTANLTATGYEVVNTVAVAGVTGSVIRKAPVGSYKVTAYNGSTAVDTVYFSTVDTQSPAVLSDIKSQTYTITLSQADIDNGTAALITAVGGVDDNNGLKFKVDGASVNIVAVEAVGTPEAIAVKTVTVRKLIKDNADDTQDVYLDYKVNVGLNMKKK
ncbi:hypothetical protein I5677_05430 [Mobilitalea sibirica]|uniref:BIG2 domain-containing protein n=1 Tax=Mobilitalea sibirica TaxID=1462919 RepID=A0A8J7H1M4_9FIRM|nr:hypothetical protein [Mobilitalea sibirica]MBH1940337.1 hypothetical protein [Mobilitalea sibirica]